jgi:uncharacterized iron-regulated membrane protein
VSWWYSERAIRLVQTCVMWGMALALADLFGYVCAVLFGPAGLALCLPIAAAAGFWFSAVLHAPPPPRPGDDLIGV